MRVALSIPIEYDGATFDMLIPDAVMARLLPAVMRGLQAVPEELAGALQSGNASEEDGAALMGLMGDPELLSLASEAFDRGCSGWHGVEVGDGAPLVFGTNGKAAIPLLAKLLIVVTYIMEQQALSAKKEPPA